MKVRRYGFCAKCAIALPAGHHGNVQYCVDCKPRYIPSRARFVDAKGNRVCRECSADLFGTHRNTEFCKSCLKNRQRPLSKRGLPVPPRGSREYIEQRGKTMCHKIVTNAVLFGFMFPADHHDCADCGRRAGCYDHRDYNKPLDVVPVCISCNVKRGAGKAFSPVGKGRLQVHEGLAG